jgi:hypothetical protein
MLSRRNSLPYLPKIFKNKVPKNHDKLSAAENTLPLPPPKNHAKLSPQKITPKIITQNARFAFFTKIICPKIV